MKLWDTRVLNGKHIGKKKKVFIRERRLPNFKVKVCCKT